MVIPHGKFVPLPVLLYMFLWLEVMYFIVAAFVTYFRGFRDEWGRMCSSQVGRMQLWIYSMTHGVGLGVVAYLLVEVLRTGRISRIEAEVLFVAQSAWVGVTVSFLAPPKLPLARGLLHPQVLMFAVLCMIAWDLPRRGCLAFCGFLVVFGVRRNFEYQRVVFEGKGWTPDAYFEAENELNAVPQTKGETEQ
mmetsp:Transcript_69013/g.191038  ORF Transcript_69013/g.191038 Transcript_69013/m.191038 type:complete len:192 (-) Transcript_69013:134-709(-)